MSRKTSVGILSVTTALAAVFLLSPYWSSAGLGCAARDGNADALADYVDFERLRQDLKSQATMAMASELRSEDDWVAGLGAVLGAVLVDRIVDTVVTPETLAKAVSAAAQTAGSDGVNSSRMELAVRLLVSGRTEWVGLSTVRVHIDEKSSMTFRRSGLKGRLTRLTVRERFE